MKELATGIAVFENVFPDSMEYIKRIQEKNISWNPAEVLVNQDKHESGTNYKARDTDLIKLPHHTYNNPVKIKDFNSVFHKNIKP